MVVEAVAFDLMDTVVRDPFREALRAATDLELPELLARRDPDAWPAFERGELTEDEYVATFTASGVDFDVEAFHRTRHEHYALLPGMAQLLDELEGEVRRVAATNYPVWVDEVIDRFLRGRFEAVVASCEVGVRKPDPGFYERVVEAAGTEPERVLFVDDRSDNVRAARAAGLLAHRFDGVEGLRRRLRREGTLD